MHDRAKENRKGRMRRHARVRRKSFGTSERPRLAVFRSTQHMNAQIINDVEGKTLVAVTTSSKDFLKQAKDADKIKRSVLLGKLLAEKAKEAGLSKVQFDRGGFAYHGRVRAFAESARKGGLDF